jgi:3-phenylpropionate/trans-cinnamate dioxygenase ferredoxin reductase component
MNEFTNGVVIVGGGMAGDACITELRREGYSGRITMIGEESWQPYERPPLSKIALREPELISGSFFLKPEGWYHDNAVDLQLSRRVTDVDLHNKRVEVDTGDKIAFGRLLIATGGNVRRFRLEGGAAANISYLRTKNDALQLAAQLAPGVRLVVVGMGVIGSEIAASARQLGCEVHAIEPESTPMVRALGSEMGRWLAAVHEEHGIRVLYGRSLQRFIMDGDRVCAVECYDGSVLDCDAVCVGIGIIPRTELAMQAGLLVDDGILVDSSNRTSCDSVFAAGDVARVPALRGGTVRYETYQNAADQGTRAARAMLGATLQNPLPCSFWSDQYDLNIQIMGIISDELVPVIRPLPNDGFIRFYLENGIARGCVAVNAGRDLMPARRIVFAAAPVDAATLASPDMSLRGFLVETS